MMSLTIHDFSTFYKELWGYEPFPWQQRLAERIHLDRRWPEALDLPTGTGKTSALDIAVFTLALDTPPKQRTLPLRIVLVVDRRTIVDQAALRARHIAQRLQRGGGPVLEAVARALLDLAGPLATDPILPVTLRGAMPKDERWARSATQPMIVASTVDQVGSRLLFRGYGTSPRSRSIHAGLLGNDSLLLLDEVHLSRPFQQTLAGLTQLRGQARGPACMRRWQVVELSATRAPGGAQPFALQAEDHHHPLLAKRLSAAKPTALHLVEAKGSEPKRREQLSAAAVEEVRAALEERSDRVVGVIHNRVDGALRTWRALKRALGRSGTPVHLVTGRMRPLERIDIERELRTVAGPERDRRSSRPAVVVATQCLEAGADLDFDVMVSECASFDALVQRMGRLNRRGQCADARAVVLARHDQVAPGSDDPIYGQALAATWQHLAALETVDFGRGTTLHPPPEKLPSLLPPRLEAPVLLPTHLDAWAQTNPGPYPDPDISLFLHGPMRATAEVSLVWRVDLSPALLEEDPEHAVARVEALPPGSTESISLPLRVVRRWLEGGHAPDLADIEGANFGDGEDGDATLNALAVAWRGDDSAVVGSHEIRPGDTVVVPCSYGGLEGGTFCPDRPPGALGDEQLGGAGSIQHTALPRDLAEQVQLVQRGRAMLRLDPECLRSWAPLVRWPPLPSLDGGEEIDSDQQVEDRVTAWLEAVQDEQPALPPWAEAMFSALLRRSGRNHIWLSDLHGADRLALRARRRIRGSGSAELGTQYHSVSFTDREVTLVDHLAGVASFARDVAVAVGLDEDLAEALELAARLHDIGKADPRFQTLLRGGDSLMVDGGAPLLAKSGRGPTMNAAHRRHLHRRSAYPRGTRHELLSVAMLQDHPQMNTLGEHAELALHLIGSHHGWCRPLAPVEPCSPGLSVSLSVEEQCFEADTNHGLARIDSGVARRFWYLNRAYGWHGLAWLEALLRLSDQRRSEWDQQQGGEV
jgi:CRISPR-associated endonuclease/helicase Cas3